MSVASASISTFENSQKATAFPIGIFDSGIGGLTVLRQMMRAMPCESFVYLGDTARVPYGEKSSETIVRYSIENSIFLVERNIKLLVVACNTASACSLERLRALFRVPVVGVIEPAVEKACLVTRNQKIAILGTKGTIRTGVYQKEIQKRLPDARIFSIACPLFVPFIEEGLIDHPALSLIAQEYLSQIEREGVDTVVLGCTHYPFIYPLLQKMLGPNVVIIDSAHATAEAIASQLQCRSAVDTAELPPKYEFFVSDDPLRFQLVGEKFLGTPIHKVGML